MTAAAPVDVVARRLDGVRGTATKMRATCPVCRRKGALSVGEGRDGRALIRCFVGCDVATIVGAIGSRADALANRRAARCAMRCVTSCAESATAYEQRTDMIGRCAQAT